jgi:drug/metabolite transporter (DMT)-like permease
MATCSRSGDWCGASVLPCQDMSQGTSQAFGPSTRSLHRLGVVCGIAAGAWLGAAEVPTKLVGSGLSPFLVSLGMVAGVFVARWTVPMILKGTGYVFRDIREKPHLIVWAILAGSLWAVANTLTIFAIRDVGLSIAFPLWNTNSLIGLLWGWLLFGELSGSRQRYRVLGGAAAITAGAWVLAYASSVHSGGSASRVGIGITAALGAGMLWGTMYIPYRKAYLSGMNPLSFVTVFTFGELGSMLALAAALDGGFQHLASELVSARSALFWLFLGGFCWVLGDLFQQFAAKYIGLGRGIPLSNTNQLWGLAWGALVFGEMAGKDTVARTLIICGSIVMAAGAWVVSSAEAPDSERARWRGAVERECLRYGLRRDRLIASLEGRETLEISKQNRSRRNAFDLALVLGAIAIFVWLATTARRQPVAISPIPMAILTAATLALLVVGGLLLWQRTRFS